MFLKSGKDSTIVALVERKRNSTLTRITRYCSKNPTYIHRLYKNLLGFVPQTSLHGL